MPDGTNKSISEEGIEYYNNLINALKDAGMSWQCTLLTSKPFPSYRQNSLFLNGILDKGLLLQFVLQLVLTKEAITIFLLTYILML